MDDWGSLDGGDPSNAHAGADRARGAAPNGGWGSLDGDDIAGDESDRRSSVGRRDDGWGSLDDGRPPAPATTDHPSRANGLMSTPEATASLLSPNQTVWAKVDRFRATLGSGQHLTLTDSPTDDLFGWRQVRIIDPARLLGELVPVHWAPFATHTADEPSTLYRPPPIPTQPAYDRVSAFPVDAGPNLEALFDRRVEAAKANYERMAQESADQINRRIAEYEDDVKIRIAQERQRATQAIMHSEQQAANVRAAADQEIARFQREIAESRGAVQRYRTLLAVTAISSGVALILITFIFVVLTSGGQ